MKIIEAQQESVELTDREQDTKNRRDFAMDLFHLPVEEAAREALDKHKGKPSKAFVEWVSDGTLTVVAGEVTTAG